MKSLFDFTPDKKNNLKLPKDIIKMQCDELAKMTDELVLGKINEYDGPIDDYMSGLTNAGLVFGNALNSQKVSIQSKLGETSDNDFTYEFIISSKYTPNFAYRAFFIRYGISIYPVRIVLDETIAKQLNIDCSYICNSEEIFVETLGLILNSQKVKDVINNLYNINLEMQKQEFEDIF